MGCLTCCRWCCCCFLATINVLTTILGIAFFVLGCVLIWGYWLFSQVTEQMLKNVSESMNGANIEIKIDMNSLQKATESILASTAIIFLVLGVLLIVISCLGCCGACFGVPACLIIYAVIVGLLVLAQASVVVVWFSDGSMFKRCARSWLEKRVVNYKGAENMDVETMQHDILQIGLQCCGVDNGDDFYKPGAKWNRTVRVNEKGMKPYYANASYPYSCCKFNENSMVDSKCSYTNVTTEKSNYRVGCLDKINYVIDTQLRLNNFFYAIAGSLGMDALLIVGALIIFFHKRQEQADIPHSNVQYKMQPQMA